MSLVCEISGEAILNKSENEAVVTPSGHVCIKRLLLTKLTENGGMDPFEAGRPLTEDQLVTLSTSNTMSKPRPQASSLPSMLSLIQSEYDALVLELFDTRKALEETRRELSQALYQNDAAIRVVARVSQERDAIQQQLEQWKASAGTSPAASTAAAAEAEPPANKRRRVESKILENDLADEDVASMSEVWAQLNKIRKPTLKAAAAEAPSAEAVGKMAFQETKAWHKSTNKGIPCLASKDGLTVTAGKDKQLVVYSESEKVVKHTFALRAVATACAIGKGLVVAGTESGKISAYFLDSDAAASSIEVGSSIVDVSIHPTGQHVCAATQDGRVLVCLVENQELRQVASFSSGANETYTAASLHPDGLIYVAGTATGKLHIWDFKNKNLAATLQVSLILQLYRTNVELHEGQRETSIAFRSRIVSQFIFFVSFFNRREMRKMLFPPFPFRTMDTTLRPDTNRLSFAFGI